MFNNILATLWKLILFLTLATKHIKAYLTAFGIEPSYYYLPGVILLVHKQRITNIRIQLSCAPTKTK